MQFSLGLVKQALVLWKKSATQILMKDLVHQFDVLVLNDTPPLRISKSNMVVKNLVLEL